MMGDIFIEIIFRGNVLSVSSSYSHFAGAAVKMQRKAPSVVQKEQLRVRSNVA